MLNSDLDDDHIYIHQNASNCPGTLSSCSHGVCLYHILYTYCALLYIIYCVDVLNNVARDTYHNTTVCQSHDEHSHHQQQGGPGRSTSGAHQTTGTRTVPIRVRPAVHFISPRPYSYSYGTARAEPGSQHQQPPASQSTVRVATCTVLVQGTSMVLVLILVLIAETPARRGGAPARRGQALHTVAGQAPAHCGAH